MLRTSVQSTNLLSIGYDPDTSTLEVEFKDGSIYQYLNVPKHIYDGLMKAASHGTYFDRHIKKGVYRFKQIR